MKIAIYPGSFDPITLGHIDIIERGSKIFDKLIVCVMINIGKKPYFSVEQKLDMIKKATSHIDNIEIDYYAGLLVDYSKETGITTILKGLRSPQDLEMEHQMANLNKKLYSNIETIFLMCQDEHRFLCSTAVRQLMEYKGNFSPLVHKSTYDYIKNLEGE